ncbi:RNA-binding domain-containing protein [Testicularia cyperi]|uniref:RNA-binding domain-containing protein n=1 Tax=Testicularia cyperi TaxID=1882483 RepID=A0A317XZV8_9BASI|nr:RNA-binding domain-containing protein [Testicularia cyperi]
MSQDRARSRSPGAAGSGAGADRGDSRRGERPKTFQDRAIASQHAAVEASRRSQKDCRVYVGNLSYGVKWNTLKDFMREAGNVVFSEVLTLPNGQSKGCGIVEYSSPEEAQKAIREMSDKQLEGRQVFVREDREDQARYGAPGGAPVPRGGARGGFAGAGRGGYGPPPGRGGYYAPPPPAYGGGYGGGYGAPYGGAGAPTQLYVSNLPFETSWQDLKDLFRAAGSISRADINMGPDGRSKGTGIVAFANSNDASNAIAMYHGFDYRGRILEVRLDRFAAGAPPPPPMDSYGRGGYGPPARGGYGAPGGYGARGGYGGGRGGHGGGYGGGHYDAYGGGYGGGDRYSGAGAYGGRGAGGYEARPPHPPAAPSQQIFVKNLPWSTSNDDLVELFQTTGTVDEAEILFDGGRSKGCGVVQFATVEDAETAIAKFNNYVYGGRPLDIEFNRRWTSFASATAGAPTGPSAAGSHNAHAEPAPPADYVNGGDVNMQS